MKLSFKKIKKIAVLVFVVCIITSNITYAAMDIKGQFSGTGTTFDATPVKNIISTILNISRIIGTGIALIILTYIGAKIMLVSPTERANIKQYSINYVIGAVILIGASGILTIIKEFIDGVIKIS